MPLAVACTNEEQITVTATPKTAGGHVAQLDGPLRITVQSGDGSFTQDAASPLVFKAVSGDAIADTVYLVQGDADLGAGVTLIQDTVTLSVGSATAANLGFVAGPVEPKPVAAPPV